MSKVYKNPKSGCWEWTCGKNHNGYGQYWDGKTVAAHRFSFQNTRQLDPGLVVDHLCRNRSCVNPDHLRQITRVENVLIGEGLPAKNRKKTLCDYGHSLSGYNLVIHGTWRRCRECMNRRHREYRKRKSLQAPTPQKEET